MKLSTDDDHDRLRCKTFELHERTLLTGGGNSTRDKGCLEGSLIRD